MVYAVVEEDNPKSRAKVINRNHVSSSEKFSAFIAERSHRKQQEQQQQQQQQKQQHYSNKQTSESESESDPEGY